MEKIYCDSLSDFELVIKRAKNVGMKTISSGVLMNNPETRETILIIIPQRLLREAMGGDDDES